MVELLNTENPSQSAQMITTTGMLCMKLGRFDTQLKQRFGSPVEPDFAGSHFYRLRHDFCFHELWTIQNHRWRRSRCGLNSAVMGFVISTNLPVHWMPARCPVLAAEISPLHIFRFYKGRNMAAVDVVLAKSHGHVGRILLSLKRNCKRASLLDAWWNHQDDWVCHHISLMGMTFARMRE